MPIGLALGGHESWRLMTALVNTMDCSRISWKLLLNVNRLVGGWHYPYCERVSCGACKIDVTCSVSLAEDSGVIAPLSSNVLSGCSTSSWKPYFSAVRFVKFASRSNSLWLCHVGHWKWHPLMPLTSLASMTLHLPTPKLLRLHRVSKEVAGAQEHRAIEPQQILFFHLCSSEVPLREQCSKPCVLLFYWLVDKGFPNWMWYSPIYWWV